MQQYQVKHSNGMQLNGSNTSAPLNINIDS